MLPIFGQRRPYLEFRWLVRGTNWPRWEYVYDSVGVTQAFNLDVMPGFRLELQGAVLNGVTYGTVITSAGDKGLGVVSDFGLFQNYPNPFNPVTIIQYALPHKSQVTLAVYNMLGQQVATLVNGEVEAGYHEVTLNAKGLASGVYFYRLQAGDYTETKKLCLVR